MNPRLRRLLLWVGYPCYALVVLVVMLYVTFPYDRVKAVVESKLSSAERSVTIGSLSARPLLGLSAQDVLITLRPQAALTAPMGMPGSAAPVAVAEKAKVQRLRLEQVKVSVGLFALIGGGMNVDFAVKGFGGELSGNYRLVRKGKRVERWGLELTVDKVSAKEIPQLQTFGPPLGGTLSGKVKLEVPGGRLSKANGEVDLELASTVLGDNKAKIKIKGNPMLAMGVTLPKIRLGRVAIKLGIKNGNIKFENVGARSPDVELKVEGGLSMRQPFAFSTIRTYVMLKPSPLLKKRDSKFELLESSLAKAKRSDGFMGILISGILRSPRVTPSRLGLGKSAPGRQLRPRGLRRR